MVEAVTLTADDKALRIGKITGSTAAAALGLDPYCTPLGAYLRIIGEHPDDAEDNDDERARGHVLEPALIGWGAEQLARETGSIVAVDRPGTIVHPSIPWAAVTPDALLTARKAPPVQILQGMDDRTPPAADPFSVYGAEAKTVNATHARAWGRKGTDQIPMHVAVQCTWQLLHVPEAIAVLVPALVGAGMELRLYWWQRHPDVEASCVRALERWHARHVLARNPPRPGPRDVDLLAHVWEADPLHEIEATPELVAAARAYEDAKRREKAAKTERDAAKLAIATIMQGATAARGTWGEVTWPSRRTAPKVRTADAIKLAERRMPGCGEVIAAALAECTTNPTTRALDVRLVGNDASDGGAA